MPPGWNGPKNLPQEPPRPAGEMTANDLFHVFSLVGDVEDPLAATKVDQASNEEYGYIVTFLAKRNA